LDFEYRLSARRVFALLTLANRRWLKTIALGLALLVFTDNGSLAQRADPTGQRSFSPRNTTPPKQVRQSDLSKRDKADIARIETYFDSIRTLSGRFYQISSLGEIAEGRISLSRPGKLRIEYNPPVPILIIADGRRLVYYDSELQSVNTFRIEDTPAYILLRDKLDLGADVEVVGFDRGKGVLRLTVLDKENPDIGRLTLVFADNPLILKKWIITDPQGVTTTVALLDTRTGMELKPQLFDFEDPRTIRNPLVD